MKIGLTIALLFAVLLPVAADTLTLVTGEKLEGQIVTETPDEYEIRLANEDFTIVHVRPIPVTNATSVVRDTPQQKAARQNYETLCRYRLSPDQEQTAKQSGQVIAAMEKFLAGSPDAANVRTKLTAWQNELANVSKGLVKFQNRWMTPADKAIAVRAARQQAQLQTAQTTIEKFRRQIPLLVTEYAGLTNALASAQQNLALSEIELGSLQDFVQPEFSFRPVGGRPQAIIYGNSYSVWSPPFWERYVSGEKITIHPGRANQQQRVRYYQDQVSSYRIDIETAERKLAELRAKLAQAEAALAASRNK